MPTDDAAPPAQDTVELRTAGVAHLFDPLDASPIASRDLSQHTEDFLVGWARDIPRHRPFRIVIRVPPAEAAGAPARDMAGAVAAHFRVRAQDVRRELRELFRVGRISLLIGIAVLVVCVASSRLIGTALAGTPLSGVLEEGLFILGWVANWRPLEIYLYEWWPLRRRMALFRRIAAAPVEVLADTQAPGA